jgi:hypothetical protein
MVDGAATANSPRPNAGGTSGTNGIGGASSGGYVSASGANGGYSSNGGGNVSSSGGKKERNMRARGISSAGKNDSQQDM